METIAANVSCIQRQQHHTVQPLQLVFKLKGPRLLYIHQCSFNEANVLSIINSKGDPSVM